MELAQVEKIINNVEEGWTLLSVSVPTRALRIISDVERLKFRVEQLNPTDYSWRPVSTHSGDKPFESFYPALEDMGVKQTKLKELVRLERHKARMAAIKAQDIH